MMTTFRACITLHHRGEMNYATEGKLSIMVKIAFKDCVYCSTDNYIHYYYSQKVPRLPGIGFADQAAATYPGTWPQQSRQVSDYADPPRVNASEGR